MVNASAGLGRLRLYGDAVRCMTTRQLLYRTRRLLPYRLLALGTRARDPDAWRPLAGGLAVDHAPQSGPTPRPEATGTFDAVGHRRTFRDHPDFWRADEDGLLFAFQLHGFSELANYASTDGCAEHDRFWISVVSSWLDCEGQPSDPGWHPYPMSCRIVAWCSALSRGRWPAVLQERMLRSLVHQAAVLTRCVEHDIGGNHVLRNATALTFAGVCLGDERMERKALSLLRDELSRQVLADGGHEERSTSYHRVVLSDVIDVGHLLERGGRRIPGWLVTARQTMTAWDRAMRGPDGRLPMLNDAWEGPPAQLEPPRCPVTILRESGYVVMRHGSDQAIFDVGLLAPPHLPPHAHADALSFVLWADGRPLITDPGSFSYSGSERARFRGTAAHNTLEVDELDQCELWGDFRAAYMPRVELSAVDTIGDVTMIVGGHDGYGRLADPVKHQRTLCWLPGDGLVVIDELLAEHPHRVRSRLHLAPGTSVQGNRIGPLCLRTLGSGPTYDVLEGSFSPYIGTLGPIQVIERSLLSQPHVPFGWALLRPHARAALEGRMLTVERSDGQRFDLEITAAKFRDPTPS